ncbi:MULTISPECIES: N-acetylmuramoyl-L-alanine amidase [Sphingobacterium]|uniref:N-acetylmuramoyl-L-alanine amidase n=1 Tax=Sphingobacterium TaxID=28453 RepID=UPI0013D933D6|nr:MULTISPECIES: N-acetylmuramoyl-L-alanine amidase [unclassified Sphingobacterium]
MYRKAATVIGNRLFSLTFLGLVCSSLTVLAQTKPYIMQRSIQWNVDRERHSLGYLLKRQGIHPDTALIAPRIIVVHSTEMSVNATFKNFTPVILPSRKDLQGISALNIYAQIIIGHDGSIYQLLGKSQFARHMLGLNYCTMGIENIGAFKNPLTAKQLQAMPNLLPTSVRNILSNM